MDLFLKEFKKELEEVYPNFRSEEDVKNCLFDFINKKEDWSLERKEALKNSFTILDKSILLIRDEDNSLQIVKNVIKLNTWGLDEIRQYAKQKSLEFWGLEYDGDIVLVNRDWKSRLASFNYNTITGEYYLKFSRLVNLRLTEDELKDNIEHELVHWYLHKMGLPNRDTDEEFISEIERLGIGSSKTGVALKALERYRKRNKTI